MTDQELFDKLKRDGECWRKDFIQEEWEYYTDDGQQHYTTIDPEDGTSPYTRTIRQGHHNPDFSTPDGFFWLWERAQEKEWWNDFFSPYDPWGIEDLIHRTRFTEALKRYIDLRCL